LKNIKISSPNIYFMSKGIRCT